MNTIRSWWRYFYNENDFPQWTNNTSIYLSIYRPIYLPNYQSIWLSNCYLLR